jgi:hypothetical protein
MQNFKTYLSGMVLTEAGAELNADLIYQKIIDVLDHAHIDFEEDRIRFHVGRITKNSAIDVGVVIRPSDEDDVRLGKSTNGDYTIVIDVAGDMPARSDIDDFIANDRMRAMHVKKALSSYLSDYHNEQDAPLSKTKYEDDATDNEYGNFERQYESLVRKLGERMSEYGGVCGELDSELDTEDMGRKEAAKMARTSLSKEYFGNNVDEFKKIAGGLLKAGYMQGLTKENKEKILNRLGSYYDQKVKPNM